MKNKNRIISMVLLLAMIIGVVQIEPIRVEASSSINSIQIIESPSEYTAGDEFKREEVIVQVNYINGTSANITNYKTPDINVYVPKGLRFLVVEYMGYYDSTQITVQNPIEDIGLDMYGNSVDLDLWRYTYKYSAGVGSYELSGSPLAGPHYLGDIVEGAIVGNIPAYINGLPVTGMQYTFNKLSDLTVIPEIPKTVINMTGTFYETGIKGEFQVPDNLEVYDNVLYGTTGLTVKYKEDLFQDNFHNTSNISQIDTVVGINLLNLGEFKLGYPLNRDTMEVEVVYSSGDRRLLTASDKLNYLNFKLDSQSENFGVNLRSSHIGKSLNVSYDPRYGGYYTLEVTIPEFDIIDLRIQEVKKPQFSVGDTIEKSDLVVVDILGGEISNYEIVTPRSILTIDDTIVEVQYMSYSAIESINVTEIITGTVTVEYSAYGTPIHSTTDTYSLGLVDVYATDIPEGYQLLSWETNLRQVEVLENQDSKVVFQVEEIPISTSNKGTITIEYWDLNNGISVSSSEVEYATGVVTVNAETPEGYRLVVWEEKTREILLSEGETKSVMFYVEQATGTVNIEKWVDNSWSYWNNTIQLSVGIHTINASDYYTESDYVIVGESSKTIEVLEGQITTVRFDYETPPQGFVNLIVITEDGEEVGNTEFTKSLGAHTINLYDWWGNGLFEVVGGSEKVVEVIDGSITVEFTVRKLLTGNVNKIAKYNEEIIWEETEVLATGEQEVYAPSFNDLYMATDSSKQVLVIEGETVDVIFNYTKQPSYFVKMKGKDNVSNEVLYAITEEKSLNEIMISPSWFDGEDNYDMVGDYWKQVENPQAGETIELVWLYQKATTGWVKVIGYDEVMTEIYSDLIEIREEGGWVNAPEIDNYNPIEWSQYVEETSPSPETAPEIIFSYTLSSGGEEPEVPSEDANIILTANPTNFKVTLPIKIQVHQGIDGEVTIADNYYVGNESALGMVKITNIDIVGSNGWVLDDIDNNFKNKRANSKEFGIMLNGVKGLDNKFAIEPSIGNPIRNGESMLLDIEMKIAPQTDAKTVEISQLVFTVDFY